MASTPESKEMKCKEGIRDQGVRIMRRGTYLSRRRVYSTACSANYQKMSKSKEIR